MLYHTVYDALQIYAPINVMPHYHRYGLRWGRVGLENYNSPPTGEVLVIYKPPHTPTNLPVAKAGVSGDRRGFA